MLLCGQNWDGDRFEQIVTLEGHKAEVLGLAVAPKGGNLYSVGADRSVRVWIKTDEIVFLEEEQEKRLDVVLEKDLEEVCGQRFPKQFDVFLISPRLFCRGFRRKQHLLGIPVRRNPACPPRNLWKRCVAPIGF